MDHLLQIDWPNGDDNENEFIKEHHMDNSVIERILRNQFRDPMMFRVPDEKKPVFDWDEIFGSSSKKTVDRRKFVPGLRGLPPFPKLSALTKEQHFQCLKVLCAQNSFILGSLFLPRPTKYDHKVLEDVLVTYSKEQKEFMEWAKHIWTTEHCMRALRPKPLVEAAYDAEFHIKAKEMASFPKKFTMAAQIPLELRNVDFDMTVQQVLIGVDITELPSIIYPQPITKLMSIMIPNSMPEPCSKHPCRFVLPHESSTTVLPLTEVHKVLAQYALDNGVEFIASEKALKCLLEVDRGWTINLSVCEAFAEDGEKRNVLVLGGELLVRKEGAQNRTYRAFRHLLQHAMVPREQKPKLRYESYSRASDVAGPTRPRSERREALQNQSDEKSSDEDNLYIADEEAQTDSDSDSGQMETDELGARLKKRPPKTKARALKKKDSYKCPCEDTMYERPPPRSFKKWRLRNLENQERYDVIIHCSHKLRDEDSEVLLEPIPEYQLDLAVSELSEERNKSFALSLNLRENATLMTVRVDGSTGEVVMTKSVNYDQHALEHGEQMSDIAQTIASALEQLRHLLPGHYLLRHEVGHGRNGLLFAPGSGPGHALQLDFEAALGADVDEAAAAKTPPKLEPTLMPWHKYRRILPCAFTPFEQQVAKETKKPPAKNRHPPAAMALEAEAEGGAKVKWRKNKKTRGKKGKRKI